jgi:geranylgeranyl diphosphate synthase type 3
VPAAHHIYGIPQTINCANYVYFLALSELTKLNKPNMIIIYTEELINLHRGQGNHLSFKNQVL